MGGAGTTESFADTPVGLLACLVERQETRASSLRAGDFLRVLRADLPVGSLAGKPSDTRVLQQSFVAVTLALMTLIQHHYLLRSHL